MTLTKQQRLEKLLNIIEKYKPHKEKVLNAKCRVCLIKKANIYYYESFWRSGGGLEIVCRKCKNKTTSLSFKLSLQDRFLLEVLL